MIPPEEKIDPERYLALIHALAEGGNAKAQHNLGAMYLKGLGVERNPQRAAEWFERSARQGDALSQHNLGILYLQGIGVDKDHELAVSWLRRAAMQGDARSAHCLGALYFEGVGVAQDLVRAFVWLSRARSGVPEELLESLQAALDLVTAQLDPESLRRAQARVANPDVAD